MEESGSGTFPLVKCGIGGVEHSGWKVFFNIS
jgi:hypothetical protein